ncbi:MAG: magnesium chelatase domain-containing protein [Candidatus Kapaibacterium sp.]
MLLAVLEKRLGLRLGEHDVFVNIAGGVRVDDPTVDLAVAAAIVSSFRDIPTDSSTAIIGEVGLGGEIRGVAHVEGRVAESIKLGFETVVMPAVNLKKISRRNGVNFVGAASVLEGINGVL